MQLAGTLPRVPEDLFRWKKEKMEERVTQISKAQSKRSAAALHKKPSQKSQAAHDLMVAPLTTKRLRTMTARISHSDAQLQTLRHSLATA